MIVGRTQKSRTLQARIVSGSMVLLSGSGLTAALNLVYNLVIARYLGPENFGQATVVYTLLTLLSAITLSYQIVCSKIVAQQETEAAKAAGYRMLHRSSWSCGLVVGLVLFLLRSSISSYLNLHDPVLIALLAIGLAAVFGIALGVLMGMSRTIARVADVWIAALYPLPKISLIPLLIIWVGTGEAYKIVISAVSAFFPIVISTYSGIRQTDRGLIKAAKDLGANARQIQLKVVIPGAIPSIFAGLHLGMGIAIILVVAAEMIGGSSQGGMGWLLISSGQVMETEKVFASLVVLAVVGAVVIKLQQWIDRKVAPWVSYHDG